MMLLEHLTQETVEMAKDIKPIYENRIQAGLMIADICQHSNIENPHIFAIPNGSIPVAIPVCERLNSPLHLAFASKIPFVSDRRFGMGSVTPDVELLNEEILELIRMTDDEKNIQKFIEIAITTLTHKRDSLSTFIHTYPQLHGATGIILDDGISTGYTVLSVVPLLQKLQASKILVVTPVMSLGASERLEAAGIEYICPHVSQATSFLVDNHYHEFSDITVDQAKAMLSSFYDKRN